MFNFNFDDGPESSVIRNGSLLQAMLEDSCAIVTDPERGTRSYLISNGCRTYSIDIEVLSNGDWAVVEFMELPQGHNGPHVLSSMEPEITDEEEQSFAEIIHINFGSEE